MPSKVSLIITAASEIADPTRPDNMKCVIS